MTLQAISAMEIFFSVYCNEDGGTQVPNCAGCEFKERGPGCKNPDNPLNVMEREVLAGK